MNIQILEQTMYPQQSNRQDPVRSRGRPHKETLSIRDQLDQQQLETIQQLKQQNTKLKKMLKQAQAKRTQITKECSSLSKTIEKLEQQNEELKHQVRDEEQKCEGEKYRWEELKFLNKQLSSEMQELRHQNESLSQKLRYSSDILERKYEQLQEKTHKRMQQCVKRVKKAIHYLESLSVKNLEKTREDLIDNLRKAIELLRGKYYQELNCEGEIDELMNPLRTMQEEILQRSKEASHFKQENIRLLEEMAKYKQMQKEQIPMFKEAIDKLKKNLVQVRSQLSQNEYQKMQIKKKYQEKLKESEYKYNQIFKECRKIKLQKKIYENKLEELEADVEEEKERLIGENQMLKKIYNNHDSSSSRVSQGSNYKFSYLADRKTQQKKAMKKNYSTNELKTSTAGVLKATVNDYQVSDNEPSDYKEESSMLSKENLKHEICRLDQEIMEIQESLNRELETYK